MCLYSIEYERCGRLLSMGRRYLEEQDGNGGDVRGIEVGGSGTNWEIVSGRAVRACLRAV